MKGQRNIKKNLIFGIINTIMNSLFPIIFFSYASRILKPAGIGTTTFANSVVTIFTMFAMLGVGLYAIKRTASLRDDSVAKKKELSEIFWFNLICALIVTVAFYIFAIYSSRAQENLSIFLIYGITILTSVLSVDWFFQGDERFGFIALRNFIIKILSLICLFSFVKNIDDILIYVIITVGSTVLYSAINFGFFLKENGLQFKNISLKKHIKPILMVFALVVVTSIYVQIDTIMLGYFAPGDKDVAVGLYATALKIPRMVLSIITATSSILLPTLSYNYSQKNESRVRSLLSNSFAVLFTISLAASVGLAILSKQTILLFCGEAYVEAVGAMQIICPTIFFVSITNLIGIQIFYNINKIWKTIVSCAVGAVVDVILNAVLITSLSYVGVAIGTLCAEISVLIVQVVLGWKDLKFDKFTKDSLVAIVSTVVMGVCLYFINKLFMLPLVLDLLVKIFIGVFIFVVCLLIFQHKTFINYLNQGFKSIKNKLKRKN